MDGLIDEVLEKLATHPVWRHSRERVLLVDHHGQHFGYRMVDGEPMPITTIANGVTTTRYPMKRKRNAEPKPWPGFELR